jgi:Spy/CpxP family protein refolding chaperone
LTQDQKAKFEELRRKFNDETAQLRGTLLTKRLEFRSLWSNPKADPKAIMEKEKELRQIQDQLREKAFQMRLEARSILTPEQLSRLGMGRRVGPGHGGRQMMAPGGRMGYGPGAGGFYRMR